MSSYLFWFSAIVGGLSVINAILVLLVFIGARKGKSDDGA
jgi:hypothetical protein